MDFKKFSVGGWIFPDELESEYLDTSTSNQSYCDYLRLDKSDKWDKVLKFFEFLSLCHKVVVEKDEKTGNLKY